MRQEEKDLLWSYLVNQEMRIEQELQDFQARIRFRRVDLPDWIEGLLMQQRLDDFHEFALTVIRLLHLDLPS